MKSLNQWNYMCYVYYVQQKRKPTPPAHMEPEGGKSLPP